MLTNTESFYLVRINSAHSYGFKAGHEIINAVIRAAYIDPGLTEEEYNRIINSCQLAHTILMEEHYNAGWSN